MKLPAWLDPLAGRFFAPQDWVRDPAGREWLYFTLGDQPPSLFRVLISTAGDLGDHPELLLAGSESGYGQAMYRAGRLVFTSGTITRRAWWALLDASAATLRGELAPVPGSNISEAITVSQDGVWSLFGKPGRMVLMRWPERRVTMLGEEIGAGVLSPDGARAAVTGTGAARGTNSILELAGPHRVRPLGKADGLVRCFSPDGRWLLRNKTDGIQAVDVQSGEAKPILADGGVATFGPSVDGEGRLIAFLGRPHSNPALTQLWTAPFRGNQLVPRAEWNLLVDTGDYEVNKPRLSPDGRWLYFVSTMGGREGIWALPWTRQASAPESPSSWCAAAGRSQRGERQRPGGRRTCDRARQNAGGPARASRQFMDD